jgi:hypothetical protein
MYSLYFPCSKQAEKEREKEKAERSAAAAAAAARDESPADDSPPPSTPAPGDQAGDGKPFSVSDDKAKDEAKTVSAPFSIVRNFLFW